MRVSARRPWVQRAAGALTLLVAAELRADERLARGEYLATIMDCTTCHTDGVLAGAPDHDRPVAGSTIGHEVPGLGVFFAPNLTPEAETGLGTWSEDDIILAVRSGLRPDGRELALAMPWRSYAALTDADAAALAAYLKSLEPIRFEVPANTGLYGRPISPYLMLVRPD
jgi:mono/diheme cytochrome c family protein